MRGYKTIQFCCTELVASLETGFVLIRNSCSEIYEIYQISVCYKCMYACTCACIDIRRWWGGGLQKWFGAKRTSIIAAGTVWIKLCLHCHPPARGESICSITQIDCGLLSIQSVKNAHNFSFETRIYAAFW